MSELQKSQYYQVLGVNAEEHQLSPSSLVAVPFDGDALSPRVVLETLTKPHLSTLILPGAWAYIREKANNWGVASLRISVTGLPGVIVDFDFEVGHTVTRPKSILK